ncbi:PQQ-binding-like beta-propeller repeat protein [Bacillus salitolerans]|uniref:PQQ-binding-like beta-propeller repeat protein n=1 Tax=Bacillus salitolerans TaxID=1437434 RepID=A0ABW4LVV5_9BACI
MNIKSLIVALQLMALPMGCASSIHVNKEVAANTNNTSSTHSYSERSPTTKHQIPSNRELYIPIIELQKTAPTNITYSTQGNLISEVIQTFPQQYTDVSGVLTFRGNHLRDSPSYGNIPSNPFALQEKWTFTTSSSPKWGGGAGWTGQPSIIKWDHELKQMMNIRKEFKSNEQFVEVIYASLDGNVYFFDHVSGKQSRPPIQINNPIKGSISLDPRGYPLLYVGQGIPQTGNSHIGFRIYSLLDGSLLHFIKGTDSYAYRTWGAFDGAPLINRDTDTMFLGGENGLFYAVKLNTIFDKQGGHISIQPETQKYRYKIEKQLYQGIENSVAAYKNLIFFSDNEGTLQAIDMLDMSPVWALPPTDDTDASIVIDIQNDTPYLYTGTEVDKQGSKGDSILRKVNGLTGKIVWQIEIPALSILGENPVNGGLLATPIIGKHDLKNLVIFTICRYKSLNAGLLIALDKETGEEKWRWEMPNYAWSSPVDVYTKENTGYIVQCDSQGGIYLLKGSSGKMIHSMQFNGFNIEASPAVYEDTIVVANRGGQIGAFIIK